MGVEILEPSEDTSERITLGLRRLPMNGNSSNGRELHRLPIAPLIFSAPRIVFKFCRFGEDSFYSLVVNVAVSLRAVLGFMNARTSMATDSARTTAPATKSGRTELGYEPEQPVSSGHNVTNPSRMPAAATNAPATIPITA